MNVSEFAKEVYDDAKTKSSVELDPATIFLIIQIIYFIYQNCPLFSFKMINNPSRLQKWIIKQQLKKHLDSDYNEQLYLSLLDKGSRISQNQYAEIVEELKGGLKF